MDRAEPRAVDVVIALPRDAHALHHLLVSIDQGPSRTSRRTIVVVDAYSSEEILDCARRHVGRGTRVVTVPGGERGHAAALNAAVAVSTRHDIVVCAEEVELVGDWIDQLVAHARPEAAVGIVTPFVVGEHADPPFPSSPALDLGNAGSSDALLRRANAGVAVAMPLVRGPCVLITRECLAKTGPFDVSLAGGASAVLEDFGMRAAGEGFLALLAGDVCVGVRPVATRPERAARAAGSVDALADRHADYREREAVLRWRHPAKALVRRVDVLGLAESRRPLIVFIAHRWSGGVRRHLHDLARLAAPLADVLLLQPAGDHSVRLAWLREGESFELFFRLPEEFPALFDVLAALPVARLHFHHVHGLPQSILELPEQTRLPYDVTLHDYYAICPQFHLVDANGGYCGEPDEAGCAKCLAGRPAQWSMDIAQWRRAFARLLTNAERVIAPSHDVAIRLARYLPDVALQIWPHPEAAASASPPLVRVALIGTLNPSKGLRVLEACAQDAALRGLPLAFRIIGAITEAIACAPGAPVSVGGEYAEAELARILAAEAPDVLWFPAQAPETYAYTLSSALASGLPIVASELGALTERLAGYAKATLLPRDASVSRWNEALLHAAGNEGRQRAPLPATSTGTEPVQYAERYLSALRTPARTGPLEPALREAAAHAFPSSERGAADLPLPTLYQQGVEFGHREARAELRRRVGLAEGEMADLRDARNVLQSDRDAIGAELARMQRDYGPVEQALAAARARIAALESSTSWRITAPLRQAVRGARVATVRWRANISDIRQLPRRVQIAASVLKAEGARALAGRVLLRLRGGRRFRPLASQAHAQETEIRPLSFAAPEAPRVSIVIPVYGKPLLTYTCLASIATNTPAASYEVIVVDDASPEPMAEALRAVQGIRLERNAQNVGFIRSCNRGAQIARGELLVLLNNDTIVTPGWLAAIEATFRDRPDAGLVGAKLVYPDGRLQEAGGIVWRDGSAWNYGRGDDPDRPEYNYVRESDYCSGACLAVPARLFGSLGGFDERYAPAYYEDTDLAFAVRAAGRKVFYQPACRIIHFEGQTSGTDETSGIKRHQTLNQSTFRRKWAAQLATHRANGIAADLERDRAAQRRVLVIDACMLTPDQDSGSVRMQAIVELLIELGCKVTFAADNLQYLQPYVGDLQQRGVEVLYAPYQRSVSDVIAERGSEFDLVIVSRHYIADKHIPALRVFAPQALVAFDTVDLHFLREERLAELEGGAIARSLARSRRDEELALIRKADVTLIVSPVERQVLAGLVPEARVMLLSNVHEPSPGGKPFAQREGILFIGGFLHPPNTDAVLWYAQEIMPRVRAALPGVATHIVGARPPATVQAFAASDFRVEGHVPDVAPYLHGCRVSVAPLRYGAGVKGKVNQAMSHGLPVVATTPATEGMHLEPGENVLVADDAASFATEIVRLYQDEALWQRLATGGIANIRAHFSRAVAREALERLLALTDARRAVLADRAPAVGRATVE